MRSESRMYSVNAQNTKKNYQVLPSFTKFYQVISNDTLPDLP